MSPEFCEDYFISKAIPNYLQMYIQEESFVDDALPLERLDRYISDWMHSSTRERQKCYLDLLSTLLNKED